MKKLIALTALFSAMAVAGPLKVATYPVRHPVKVVKGVAKGSFRAAKAVLW